jgi:hypothetical protein
MIIQLINFLHLILVLVVSSSIFIPNYKIKQLALTFLIFLLAQYITNYGRCGLTELEYVIKGEKYQEGFLYRLIKPVITVKEDYFNNQLYLIHILYIVILSYQLLNLNPSMGT